MTLGMAGHENVEQSRTTEDSIYGEAQAHHPGTQWDALRNKNRHIITGWVSMRARMCCDGVPCEVKQNMHSGCSLQHVRLG